MGAQGEGGLITQVCDMVYSGGRGWAGVFNPWLSHVLKGCTCVRPPPQAPPCPPYTQQHSSKRQRPSRREKRACGVQRVFCTHELISAKLAYVLYEAKRRVRLLTSGLTWQRPWQWPDPRPQPHRQALQPC
jgi:hypothetical protein